LLQVDICCGYCDCQKQFPLVNVGHALRLADPRSGERLCEAQQSRYLNDPEICFGNHSNRHESNQSLVCLCAQQRPEPDGGGIFESFWKWEIGR